jgi:hypothetical protein
MRPTDYLRKRSNECKFPRESKRRIFLFYISVSYFWFLQLHLLGLPKYPGKKVTKELWIVKVSGLLPVIQYNKKLNTKIC